VKLWITLEGGREAEVEMEADGPNVWLEIEGRRLLADFRRLPDGEVYSLLMDGRAHVVSVAPTGTSNSIDVTMRGKTVPVDVRHPLERRMQASAGAAAASGETVKAPMPGLVVAIRVQAGDTVATGQPVAVIEAMKMQNELVAKHGGRVVDVLVKPGDSVSANQALVKLKAAE